MRSLPLTLVARLLPVAVLAVAGVAMTSAGDSDAHDKPAASKHPEDGNAKTPRKTAKPPQDPCSVIPAGTVEKLVPAVKGHGSDLVVNDTSRRTGCSWHALDDFDYRWLDITFDVTDTAWDKAASGTSLPGIGDKAVISDHLTTDDGQQSREAVVTVRKGTMVITVTYNGSDFDSKKAPGSGTVRDGATTAAKAAMTALGG